MAPPPHECSPISRFAWFVKVACRFIAQYWRVSYKNIHTHKGLKIELTCGNTPSIFSDGGTFSTDGRDTWPKSTVNASHQMPKWPISNTVRSPGNVSTMVLRSYLRKGTSFPFSSATRMPCGVGFSPAPTQNLASEKRPRVSVGGAYYRDLFAFYTTFSLHANGKQM